MGLFIPAFDKGADEALGNGRAVGRMLFEVVGVFIDVGPPDADKLPEFGDLEEDTGTE